MLFLCIGCTVIREGGKKIYSLNGRLENDINLKEVKKKNLTENGFVIQKAEIELNTPDGRNIFLASLKFERPDKYLLSIKSRTGIEAARIFISDDTILINDRIKQKLYCGSSDYLKVKYGITKSFLPVILGDFISDNFLETSQSSCLNGRIEHDCIIEGMKIKYVIDCKKEKATHVIQEVTKSDDIIEIEFSDFYEIGNLYIPGKILIKELLKKMEIKVSIKKFESPWKGNIEFIPGGKYEIIQLI